MYLYFTLCLYLREQFTSDLYQNHASSFFDFTKVHKLNAYEYGPKWILNVVTCIVALKTQKILNKSRSQYSDFSVIYTRSALILYMLWSRNGNILT